MVINPKYMNTIAASKADTEEHVGGEFRLKEVDLIWLRQRKGFFD